MKRHLILSLGLLSIFAASAEDTKPWLDKGVWPESPTAATIREVTSPHPSYLTGAATFSIPLHTMEADGLQIPFEYRYFSNGIRKDDDPYPWGYGWSLMPAIRVSRRIIGRPDGCFQSINKRERLTEAECFHSMTELKLDQLLRKQSDFYLDPSPDIYTIQLPGKQFTVVFAEGKAITANGDEYKIVTNELMTEFTVTDPMGYVYYFDQGGEYAVTDLYRTEWLPSSIVCPSGRMVKFSYEDWTSPKKNESQRQAKIYSFLPYEAPTSPVPGDTHPSFLGGLLLTSVAFTDSLNSNLEKVTLSYNSGNAQKKYFSKFAVSVKDTVIKQFDFKFDTSLNLMTSVDTPEGEYTFTYNTDATNVNTCPDWWGFYNGRAYPNNINSDTPTITWDNCKTFPQDEFPENFRHNGIDRTPNETAMQWRMLTKVSYPTGGQTEWEYEAHQFDREYFGDTPLSFGGGLRVSSITTKENASDSKGHTLTYHYSKANVAAFPTPDTFLDNYEAVDFCQSHTDRFHRGTQCLVISPNSNYLRYRIGQVPMWYSKVEEIAEEGKTEYSFEDLIDIENFVGFGIFDSCPQTMTYAFSNGPQQISRKIYKLNGTNYKLAQSDSLEYNLSLGATQYAHLIKRHRQCSSQSEYRGIPGYLGSAYPDFTDADTLYFRNPYWVDKQNSCSQFEYVAGAYGKLLSIPEGFAYTRQVCPIIPRQEFLTKKISTEYRNNGAYTIETEYDYLDNTGIIASETKRVKNSSITTSYTYASESSTDAVVKAMADKNIIGRPIAQSQTFGSKTIYTKEILQSGVFKPNNIVTNRGAGTYSSPTYEWSLKGKLLSVTDSAKIKTSYAWDSDSLYPIEMTKGNLVYKASWLPGVGVTSLDNPDGVRQLFTYDNKGRLSSMGISGKATVKTWNYKIGEGDNSIVETTYIRSGLDSTSSTRSHVRTNFDGLGRLASTVTGYTKGANGHFWGTAIDYDGMGRKYRETMPVALTSENPTFADALSSAESFYSDTKPYAITEYELSQRALPLNLVNAGEAWHSGDHKKLSLLLVNNATPTYACQNLRVADNGDIVDNGIYPLGTLSVERCKDEDGVYETTFTDIRGKCLLKSHGSNKTYFVYDDLGDLRYILPPNLSPKSYSAKSSELTASAYIFRYDGRGRMIYTKVPGCAASEYIYDSADRLVAETNGDLNGKWRLHFYDNCAREVLVAECTLSDELKEGIIVAQNVTSAGKGNGTCGYNLPITLPKNYRIRYVNFYDNYTNFAAADIKNLTYQSIRNGIQTGYIGYDDKNAATTETYFYDAYSQKIGTVSESTYAKTTELVTYSYDGKVLSRTETFTPRNTSLCSAHTFKQEFSYDDAGRLAKETVTLDGATKVYTNTNYDAIGRVASQATKSAETDAPTLKRSFAYDVHGWVTAINTTLPLYPTILPRREVSSGFYSAAALQPIIINPATQTYTETISYATGTKPKYNGTPSGRSLTLGGRYDYSYDYNDRLVKALYTAPTGSSADFSTEYKYDALSRPTEVKRYGVVDNNGRTETFGVLDHFTIDYNGARPYKINSKTDDIDGRSFLGRTGWSDGLYKSSATQQYNAAGRITYDDSRSLSSVRYNTYGLPVSMVMMTLADTTRYKEREYDVRGIKTRQTEWINNGVASSQKLADRRYIGSFVLNCDTLERVNFGAGYLDSKGKPHFLFTDWQGNVTMSTDSRGHIEQHVGYYPYGEPWREPAGQRLKLYGGKERQSGVLAGDYDFGPRSLNFTTLFNAPDASATSYPHLSPWSYCAANPIRNIDPTGNDWVYNETTYQYEWIDGATKDKTPEGFRYVGFSDDDILKDLNIMPNYPRQEVWRLGLGVLRDNKMGKGVFVPVYAEASGYVSAKAIIARGEASEDNKNGFIFKGVRFKGSFSQMSFFTNPNFGVNYIGGMTISIGDKAYGSKLQIPHHDLHGEGQRNSEANIFIESKKFTGGPVHVSLKAGACNPNIIFLRSINFSW